MAEFIGIRSQLERLSAKPAGGDGPTLTSRAPTSVRHRRKNPCRTQGRSAHMHWGRNLCAWLWFAELATTAPVLSAALLCAESAPRPALATNPDASRAPCRPSRGHPAPFGASATFTNVRHAWLAQPRCIDIAARRHVGALAEPPWNTPGRDRTGHGRNAGISQLAHDSEHTETCDQCHRSSDTPNGLPAPEILYLNSFRGASS